MKRPKIKPLLLALALVLSSITMFALPIQVAHATGPTLVQGNMVGTTTLSANPTSLAHAFGSNVAAGDLLVVGIGIGNGPASISVSFTVTDSQSNTYTVISTECGNGNFGTCSAMAYAKAGSSAADTVTVQETGTASGTLEFNLEEWSGVANPYTDVHQGNLCTASCTASQSTSSTSFTGSPYVAVSFMVSTQQGTISAGTSYTLDYSNTATASDGWAIEYSITVGSPTTFPFSTQFSSTGWVLSGVVMFPATVTQPITCTMDNGGANAQLALSVSSGTVSPTTVFCDGSSHSITVSFSVTLTATEPADAANTRNRFSGGGTTKAVTTCASGTCTAWTFSNFEEIQNTFTENAKQQATFDTGMTWTLTCTQIGAAGTCTISSTAATSDSATVWTDYGRTVTFPQTPSGAPSQTRWLTTASRTVASLTATGQTYSVNSYKQVNSTLKASTFQGVLWDGSMNINIAGTNASAATTMCTLKPVGQTTTTVTCWTWGDLSTSLTFDQQVPNGVGATWLAIPAYQFTPAATSQVYTVQYESPQQQQSQVQGGGLNGQPSGGGLAGAFQSFIGVITSAFIANPLIVLFIAVGVGAAFLIFGKPKGGAR